MRPSLLLLLTAVVCLVLLPAHAADQTLRFGNDTAVDFVGKSGQIKLYRDSDDAFLQLKFSKIQEVTPEGAVVQGVNNFASQDASWADPVNGTFRDADGNTYEDSHEVKLTANLDWNRRPEGPQPNFVVTVTVFDTEGDEGQDIQVWDSNDATATITIPKNALKFSVDVTDWPFQSADNFLTFGVEVKTPNDAEAATQDGNTFTFSAGKVVSLDKARANNEATVDVTTSLLGNTISWKFPASYKNAGDETILITALSFDPSVELDEEAEAAGAGNGNGNGNQIIPIGSAYALDLVGQSGQIKLRSTENNADFLQLKFSKVQELTSGGSVVQGVNNFASQDASWGAPVNGTFFEASTQSDPEPLLNSHSATLTANLDWNGRDESAAQPVFTVTVTTFSTNGADEGQSVSYWNTVGVNDDIGTLTVPKNAFKFSVNVDNWPFESPDNVLQFGVQITTNTPDESGSPSGNTVSFGAGKVVSLDVARANNEATVSVDTTATSNTITWQFPASYQNASDHTVLITSLSFDPTVSLTSADSGDDATIAVASPLIAVVLAALAAWIGRQQ